MLPMGGVGSHETSVCQFSPATCLLFSSAWMTRISGCPSTSDGAAGCTTSSPKSRPNALCWSVVRRWSRKKMTWFSVSASWISLNVRSSSGLPRSTPCTSAPMMGVSFSTRIAWYVMGASGRRGDSILHGLRRDPLRAPHAGMDVRHAGVLELDVHLVELEVPALDVGEVAEPPAPLRHEALPAVRERAALVPAVLALLLFELRSEGLHDVLVRALARPDLRDRPGVQHRPLLTRGLGADVNARHGTAPDALQHGEEERARGVAEGEEEERDHDRTPLERSREVRVDHADDLRREAFGAHDRHRDLLGVAPRLARLAVRARWRERVDPEVIGIAEVDRQHRKILAGLDDVVAELEIERIERLVAQVAEARRRDPPRPPQGVLVPARRLPAHEIARDHVEADEPVLAGHVRRERNPDHRGGSAAAALRGVARERHVRRVPDRLRRAAAAHVGAIAGDDRDGALPHDGEIPRGDELRHRSEERR